MQLTNDSDEFVSEPGCLGGEQGERGGRVFQVHVDGVDVDAAPLAHGRYGFPARVDFFCYCLNFIHFHQANGWKSSMKEPQRMGASKIKEHWLKEDEGGN